MKQTARQVFEEEAVVAGEVPPPFGELAIRVEAVARSTFFGGSRRIEWVAEKVGCLLHSRIQIRMGRLSSSSVRKASLCAKLPKAVRFPGHGGAARRPRATAAAGAAGRDDLRARGRGSEPPRAALIQH